MRSFGIKKRLFRHQEAAHFYYFTANILIPRILQLHAVFCDICDRRMKISEYQYIYASSKIKKKAKPRVWYQNVKMQYSMNIRLRPDILQKHKHFRNRYIRDNLLHLIII